MSKIMLLLWKGFGPNFMLAECLWSIPCHCYNNFFSKILQTYLRKSVYTFLYDLYSLPLFLCSFVDFLGWYIPKKILDHKFFHPNILLRQHFSGQKIVMKQKFWIFTLIISKCKTDQWSLTLVLAQLVSQYQ